MTSKTKAKDGRSQRSTQMSKQTSGVKITRIACYDSTAFITKPKTKVGRWKRIKNYFTEPMNKNGIAAVLSFVFPGLGQLYKGELLKAFLFFIGTFIGLGMFVLPGIVIYAYGIIDALKTPIKN